MTQFLSRAWHAYVGNGVAIRDYRSQLRGNRAVWIWGLYLMLLILLCALAYSGIVQGGRQSISAIQEQLTNFYYAVMLMLGALVTLAAPAMTASTIPIERQRRSLDLVFSAPVPPRYLLVGKMIGGFRYLVMLLVLALPVTAVCVVMGGATWSDVVGAYLTLLASGIVMMAIGLAVSAVSPSTISATITSYLMVGAYVTVASAFSAIFTASRFSGMGMSRSNEAVWAVILSPFTASFAAPTYTIVAGVEVPNWIFGFVFAFALSRLLLASAGSALSPFGSAETRTLRINGLVFAFVLTFLAAAPLQSAFGAAAFGSTGLPRDYLVALLVGVCLALFAFLVPNLSCFARSDVERRNLDDGIASWRGIWLGTPSGGWPYAMLVIGATVGGCVLGFRYGSGRWVDFEVWSVAAWAVGYCTLWWGVGRMFSSLIPGLRGAKVAVVTSMVAVLGLPVPVLFMIMASRWDTNAVDVWRFHPLFVLSPAGVGEAWAYGVACALVGTLLAFASKRPSNS